MARLIIETGSERGRTFNLPQKGAFAIGRDEKCAVRVDDNMASRVHCVIRCDEGAWVIQDRESLNGTRVNGSPVSEHTLAPGDSIQIGDTLLSIDGSEVDSLIGRTVGGYRVEKRLGRGAMGTVYLARQLSLDRPVALKILAPRFAKDEEFVRSFLEEARAAARLNHPNVVQVYDAGNDGDCHYMSMEFLEGGSLEEVLQAQRALPVDRAIEATRDAALALGFARQNHIVHRDIKPANLLIAADGTVKVGDLGIAADLRALEGGKQQVAGSPRYMAPEQARGQAVDHRADIYALGATLYRMVAGVPPFDGSSVSEIINAKLNSDPEPLRDRVPDAPPGLSAVVERMMLRDLDLRYATAEEVFDALDPEELRRAPPVRRKPKAKARPARAAARPARPTASRVNRQRKEASLDRLLIGGVVGVIVLVALLIGISKLTQSGGSDRGGGGEIGGGESTKTDQEPGRDSAGRGGNRGDGNRGDGNRGEGRRGPLERDGTEIASRTLRRIERDFEEGVISPSEARDQLGVLVNDHPRIRPSAEALVARVGEAAAGADKEALAAIDKKLDTLLKTRNLVSAGQALAQFRKLHPEMDSTELRQHESTLSQLCTAAVSSASGAIQASMDAGDLGAARASLVSLRATLPDSKHELVSSLESRLSSLEAKAAQERSVANRGASAVVAAGRAVRRQIGLLDFEGAAKVVASLKGGSAKVDASIAALKGDVAAARAVWTSLTARLESLARKRSLTRATILPTLLDVLRGTSKAESGSPVRFRVIGVDGPAMLVQQGSSKSPVEPRSILSLSDQDLRDFIAESASASLTPKQVDRGLGWILLARRGPDRASPFLLAQGLSAEEKARNQQLIDSTGSGFLQNRFDTARDMESRLTDAGKRAKMELWRFVAREAANLILDWKELPDWKNVGSDVRDLYRSARRAELTLAPADSMFHAAEVTTDASGLIQLTYDFSDADQLLDFLPTERGTGAIEWIEKKKFMKLSGEVRLLHENPFRERIGVTFVVPKGGYTAASPNINVALWTTPKDRVTPESDGDRIDYGKWRPGRGEDDDIPADFFVLGTGYFYKIDLRSIARSFGFGRGVAAFAERTLPDYLRQASLALLSGKHGQSLHHTRTERMWDAPSASITRGGTLKVDIQMDGKRLSWKVNNKGVDFSSSRELDRLETNAPHVGSLTFFSNGYGVYFSSIEVLGRLDPEWIVRRTQSVIDRELEELDPDGTSTKKAKDSGSSALRDIRGADGDVSTGSDPVGGRGL